MVANLKRYDFIDIQNIGVVESDSGEYVKFEEAVEASSNSLQQLKAEIAACIPSLVESYNHMRDSQFNACIEKLRQLSAV